MKTTLDLPTDLVREMKLRAAHEGRNLKDVAADLLKRGLAPDPVHRPIPAVTKGTIKLPLFPSPKKAPSSQMSVLELLALEQQTLQQEDLQRLGQSL